MSADPPASKGQRLRHWITDVEVSPGNTDPNCKFSARIFTDNELVCNLPWIDHARPLRWSGLLLCNISSLSPIVIRLCRSVNDRPRYFNFPSFTISEVDGETGEYILEIPEAVWVITIKFITPTVAERIFPSESNKVNAIEGVYDSLKPNETLKYLFKNALQFGGLVAEDLPESTAKVSFMIYMKAWELLDQQDQLDDAVQAVLRDLTCIGGIIDVARKEPSSTLSTAMNRSKEPINGILALLEDLSIYIYNRYTTSALARLPPEESGSSGFGVETYQNRLEDLQAAFYSLWAPVVVPDDKLINAVSDESSSTSQENQQTTTDEQTKIDPYEMLNLLRPMDPSGYDPCRVCMDGTREPLLNRILTWTQNPDNSERLMWISGQAGMGKTAVATSLCRKLDRIRALAGCFFCQRDDPDLSDPLRLINNLVHEIALQCRPFAQEVSQAIRANRKLCNAHLSRRYKDLVKKPLEKLKSLSVSGTQVVVVDGLDECGDYESREQVLQMLHDMSQLVPWLKVIITARPTGDLQEYFQNECPKARIIQLQTFDAAPDIRAYIEGQLERLAEKERWAPDTFDQLSAMSQGNFLWASLVTKYIKRSIFPALPRLQKVLNNHKSLVTDQFDALYTRALKTAIDDNEDDIKAAHLRCIGAILATSERDPLALPDLQYLLLVTGQIDQITLEQILKNLAPLLFVMDGGRIKFLHSSFRDYVSSSSRSGEFHIRLDECEVQPTASCLKLMQRDLRFNICNLESSHLLNSQVPDLKLRIESHIGPALKYACIHWIDHFISSPSQALVEAIKEFWNGPQIMYWIEALSLLGRLDVAISGFVKLISLELNQFNGWDLVLSWAQDAYRFVLTFYDAISSSTPHLYISALAFTPSKSLTAQRMRPYFPNTVTVAQGSGSVWHPCIKSITHSHPVQSLSISPDGLHVVVGYSDGSLSQWNIQTGTRIDEPLVGHRDSVTCVVYSPKGDLIASSSYDTTIRVWNIASRPKTNQVLSGHTGPAYAVAFSPDSAVIASGSSDKSIRLWDVKALRPTGEAYINHSSRVSALAFSYDGSRLVSGSWDKTIRVWTVTQGGQQLSDNPLVITGHSDSVTGIALSPDGSMIASCSVDRTIRLWNSRTGGAVRTCTPHSDTVTSIGFSSNGSLLVSSSLDGGIKLFDIATLEAISHPLGHSHPVNAIAFSPTGSHIISGSTDATIRVWDIRACPKLLAMPPLAGHTNGVQCVVVSRDGTRIVSGAYDHTVRMWDAKTGAPVGDAFTGHSNYVYGVAISPDGARIVSGSADKTIKLWDTAARTPLHSYQHSHPIRSVAYSPNGAQIVFGAEDNNVYLWEVAGWKQIKTPLNGHSHWVLSVAFSPDGTLVASGSNDKTVIFWNAQAHSRSAKPALAHPGAVLSVAFSPCGSKLATGCQDRVVRLWDTSTGNVIHQLKGHASLALAVIFSPDGSCVASGSRDKTVRLWNVKTGQLVQPPLTGHLSDIASVAFSPHSNHIISGSWDNKIRVWNLDTSSTPKQTTDLRRTFSWPTNTCDLSSHPDHPGWVINDQKSLAFWLPPYYHYPEHFPTLHPEVPPPRIFLDYSKFVHGTAWAGVASDSTTRSSG